MFPKKYTPKGKIIIGIYLISLLTIVIISSSYILNYLSDHSIQTVPVANKDLENVNESLDISGEGPSLPEAISNQDMDNEPIKSEDEVVKGTPESSENENGTYSVEDLKILKEAHISVYFDFQSFEITKESRVSLESFVDIIKAYPDETIVIEGHADGYPNFSNTAMEVELVSNRIKAIYDILINNSLDPSKVETINNGSSHPTSIKKEERQKNDYVEIYFSDYVIKNIKGK